MSVQSERNILTSYRWNEFLINLEWAANKSVIKSFFQGVQYILTRLFAMQSNKTDLNVLQ